jgi:hypothetical protein
MLWVRGLLLHGFVPTEIFERLAERLTPTL